MGRTPLAWGRMLVLVKGFLDETWDVCVQDPLIVVPLKFDSDEKFSLPVDRHIVIFFECAYQVVGMRVSDEFNPKIVYH